MAFSFQGELDGSKSILNRLWILKSFDQAVSWSGDSDCDDVLKMKAAVESIGKVNIFDCGHAATVMRFLAFRLSRETGFFHLKGAPSLCARPQTELVYIIEQLGPKVQLINDGILIEGEGWKDPFIPIRIPRSNSSQFMSGLLLSAWNLPFDLDLHFSDSGVSKSYLDLTKRIVKNFNLNFSENKNGLVIPAEQKLEVFPYAVEMDMSSWTYLASAAALEGDIAASSLFSDSAQPDRAGIDFLKRLGVQTSVRGDVVSAKKTERILAADFDLGQNPDLFPALVALASFAEGISTFSAVSHLQYKESNRYEKMLELLSLARVKFEDLRGILKIHGKHDFKPAIFQFDPAEDHRMAMAASLFQLRESRIEILNEHVVQKSFPNYWRIIRKNA